MRTFREDRAKGARTHGTGCALSAAIAAGLAKGADLASAVAAAKRYVTDAIRTRPRIGAASSALNFHAEAPDPRGPIDRPREEETP